MNKEHQKEIDRGRIVRGYMSVSGVEAFRNNEITSRTIGTDRHHEIITPGQPVLIILPPQPLEIQGYVCSLMGDNAPVCLTQFCGAPHKEQANCRPVTLIEKPE